MADSPPGPEDLERELERLPEVRAARVVTSPSGRILEVHLVSDGSKAPKQLTRDVETVVATKGLDIDRRTISIAQMPAGSDPTVPQQLRLASISVAVEGTLATCRVRVTRIDEDAIGEATSTASSSARHRLVAAATLDAISSLLGSHLPADCDNALVLKVGAHTVALCVLVFVEEDGSESVVPGVHPAPGEADEAIARAVLDAVNRRHEV